MPTPTFKRISVEQFAQLLGAFPFTRRITSVHMHHTWKPRHRDFDGHSTIVGMWRHHTQVNRWSNIAQHITIDPEGFIWLGRNWNSPPASAAGYNGNAASGPFMFEMIGDFDVGQDPFQGAQRETVLKVVALVQAKFDLPATSLMFHNSMSSKSCPGTSLQYADIAAGVAEQRTALPQRPRAGNGNGHGRERGPFPSEVELVVRESIERLTQPVPVGAETADSELDHSEAHETVHVAATPPARDTQPSAARDSGLDEAVLAAMRPHLVNLSQGRFSGEGEAHSKKEDVDAIFEQELPRAIKQAKEAGRKLQLLFFAHGGLVSEAAGLRVAAGHIDWWKKNNIYPIYFVWETGLFETIGQLLKRAKQGTARDLWDFTTDPLIEVAARALQGPRIWGGMKSSAEHAVDAPSGADKLGGGAYYVATKLKALCDKHGDSVELHAVGHSAGSIFHSHFLTTTQHLKVPTFKSAHFLAPAVRVDTFKELLAPKIGVGKAVAHLSVFTMKRDYERKDDCAKIYNKSLLYLIFHALEPQRSTPILGLEECLRADAELKKLFGLGAERPGNGEVVWSVSDGDTGLSASSSTSHGGFDNDAPTMNSVARRILGKADADSIIEFPKARAIGAVSRPWTEEVDWPEELAQRMPMPVLAAASNTQANMSTPAAAPMPAYAAAVSPSGRRLALCVGVDRYPNPRHELAGCVADARMWSETLGRLGFTTSLLLDEQATRAGIERELKSMLARSRRGDVIVFQFSGHGTTVPDLDGDEVSGPDDQAMCPVDFETGALFIDDDIYQVLGTTPEGVAVTCFMDCCHSGGNIRLGVGRADVRPAGRGERQRFIRATPALIEAHENFRRMIDGSRGRGLSDSNLIRHVLFSACKRDESAWESDGHGEFTVHATRLLAQGIDSVSNAQFAQRVLGAFGPNRRQEPQLYCDQDRTALSLLQPLTGTVPQKPAVNEYPANVDQMSRITSLLEQLIAAQGQRPAQ